MRRFYIGICLVLLFLFAFFGDAAMRGAVKGLELFAHGVFPALFPFCVCIGCLKRLGFFSAPESGGFFSLLRLFLLGAIAGNPTGSMLVGEHSYNENGSDGTQRSVYSALFNLASPVFIVGTVGSRLFAFSSPLPALLILLSHYLSALFIFCGYYPLQKRLKRKKNGLAQMSCAPFTSERSASLVSVFPSALMEGVSSMLKLCGTIVFFVSLAELITYSLPFASHSAAFGALAIGILEMTNGLALLASTAIEPRLALSLACFIISFGGICIFMQANAVSPVRAGAYLSVKLLHGVCAFMLCYFVYPLFSAFSVSVSNSMSETLVYRTVSALRIASLCVIASAAASLAAVLAAKRTRV